MERFWSKVDVRGPEECWPWLAYVSPNGHGGFWLSPEIGRPITAHRAAYIITHGEIPEGHQIDHVKARGCTRRDCVNPAHLEAVTPAENLHRGDSLSAQRGRQTKCSRGHTFDKANTYFTPDGRRQCRECSRARRRRRWIESRRE